MRHEAAFFDLSTITIVTNSKFYKFKLGYYYTNFSIKDYKIPQMILLHNNDQKLLQVPLQNAYLT